MNYIFIIGFRFPVPAIYQELTTPNLKALTKLLYSDCVLPKTKFLIGLLQIILPKNILVKTYLYWFLYTEFQFIVKLVQWVFYDKRHILSNTGEILKATETLTFGQFIAIDTLMRKVSKEKKQETATQNHLKQADIENLIAIRFDTEPKNIKNLSANLAVPLAEQILKDFYSLIKTYKTVFSEPKTDKKIKLVKEDSSQQWFKIIRMVADKNPLHFQEVTNLTASECLFHLQESMKESEELKNQYD
jgi:hypothetical protein